MDIYDLLSFRGRLPLFKAGEIVIVPNAFNAMTEAGQSPLPLLARHLSADWGELNDIERARMDSAIEGGELLSCYRLQDGTRLWIKTLADRSRTTLYLWADSEENLSLLKYPW